jgi:hypothetical protein
VTDPEHLSRIEQRLQLYTDNIHFAQTNDLPEDIQRFFRPRLTAYLEARAILTGEQNPPLLDPDTEWTADQTTLGEFRVNFRSKCRGREPFALCVPNHLADEALEFAKGWVHFYGDGETVDVLPDPAGKGVAWIAVERP